jgi:hypothetical protein
MAVFGGFCGFCGRKYVNNCLFQASGGLKFGENVTLGSPLHFQIVIIRSVVLLKNFERQRLVVKKS